MFYLIVNRSKFVNPIISNVYKIIIIGDPIVGKTTLRLRYIGEGFRKQYVATLGTDFALATYKEYIMQIWDLAGQDAFRNVIKTMFIGAEGVILVFDVTNRVSMENLSNWIDQFLEVEKTPVPMVVFGNKVDLRSEVASIQTDEASEFVYNLSKKYGIEIGYIETSALTGKNIKIAFEGLIDEIVE
ncbi:MAG: Rab family GTPase [Candidatus Kariarchaeaceae archaeon]